MKLSSSKSPLFFLFLALLFGLAFSNHVVDAAPFWLRQGVYAYYRFGARRLILLQNDTIINDANGTYGWSCVRITGNTATLEVTINVSGRELIGSTEYEEWKLEDTYEVDVNVETREAYLDDGHISILSYWMPTNVELGDPIANFSSYGNITLSVPFVASVLPAVDTPYRNFTGDELWFLLTETFSYGGKSQVQQAFFYEKESGLMTKGEFVDPIWHEKVKVKTLHSPDANRQTIGGWAFELSQTNIEFTQPPPSLFSLVWPYLLIATAIIAVSVTLAYILIMARRKPKNTFHKNNPYPKASSL